MERGESNFIVSFLDKYITEYLNSEKFSNIDQNTKIQLRLFNNKVFMSVIFGEIKDSLSERDFAKFEELLASGQEESAFGLLTYRVPEFTLKLRDYTNEFISMINHASAEELISIYNSRNQK